MNSTLVGVVIPDQEQLMNWAKHKERTESFAQLCADPSVKQMIFEEMVSYGKSHKLASFEQVKDIHLDAELFSVENGLVSENGSNGG